MQQIQLLKLILQFLVVTFQLQVTVKITIRLDLQVITIHIWLLQPAIRGVYSGQEIVEQDMEQMVMAVQGIFGVTQVIQMNLHL